jgi:hypothetical protein
MRFVNKMNVVGHSMNPDPVNRFASLAKCPEFFDFGIAISDGLVAGQAKPNSGYGGRSPFCDIPMAERAVQSQLPLACSCVNGVGVCDRLHWAIVISEYHRLTHPCREDKRNNQDGDSKSGKPTNSHDSQKRHLLSGRFFVLKVPWYQFRIFLILGIIRLVSYQAKPSNPARNL